jgi:hypothetical protein
VIVGLCSVSAGSRGHGESPATAPVVVSVMGAAAGPVIGRHLCSRKTPSGQPAKVAGQQGIPGECHGVDETVSDQQWP